MSHFRNTPAEFRQLTCSACGWRDVLDTEKIYRWLTARGKIRPGRDVEDEILYELFHGLLPTFTCPECHNGNLAMEVVLDDFSDLDARRCRGCAKIIPEMRLQFFPDALYCAVCAEKVENGEDLPLNVEYCPTCGAMMELQPVRRANGKTDFVWRCTKIPPCRLR